MKKDRNKNDKNDKGVLSRINGEREGEKKQQKPAGSTKESGTTSSDKKDN
jgi:hypothetical protein